MHGFLPVLMMVVIRVMDSAGNPHLIITPSINIIFPDPTLPLVWAVETQKPGTNKPTTTTEKLTPTTEKPTPTTKKPIPTTEKPTPTTEKLTPTTRKPTTTTRKPTPTTEKPTPTTEKSTPTTEKPTPTTEKPTPTTKKPIPTTEKPTPTTEKLTPTTRKPTTTTRKPTPTTEKPTPTTEKSTPTTEKLTPTTRKPTPTTRKPTPTTRKPTPTTEKPPPTTEKPTPTTEKSTLTTKKPTQTTEIWDDLPDLDPLDPGRKIVVPEIDISNDIDAGINCTLSSFPPAADSMCCGIDALSNHRIVGGNITQLEQHPWLVQIEYHDKNNNKFKRLCGGFLISGRYVLTAAHCFAGRITQDNTAVNVILGEYDAANEGRDCIVTRNGGPKCTDGAIKVPIEKYRIHPKYLFDNARNLNDIAFVRMSKNVAFTKYIRPICLPTSDITVPPPASLRFSTAGWGAIRDRFVEYENGRKGKDHLYDRLKRDVDVPFVNTEKCREQYNFLTDGHICAGGESGKDSCKGDSGGPLMYENDGVFEAVGIVSTAASKYLCGTENHAAVYTNLYRYIGWISENIKP